MIQVQRIETYYKDTEVMTLSGFMAQYFDDIDTDLQVFRDWLSFEQWDNPDDVIVEYQKDCAYLEPRSVYVHDRIDTGKGVSFHARIAVLHKYAIIDIYSTLADTSLELMQRNDMGSWERLDGDIYNA